MLRCSGDELRDIGGLDELYVAIKQGYYTADEVQTIKYERRKAIARAKYQARKAHTPLLQCTGAQLLAFGKIKALNTELARGSYSSKEIETIKHGRRTAKRKRECQLNARKTPSLPTPQTLASSAVELTLLEGEHQLGDPDGLRPAAEPSKRRRLFSEWPLEPTKQKLAASKILTAIDVAGQKKLVGHGCKVVHADGANETKLSGNIVAYDPVHDLHEIEYEGGQTEWLSSHSDYVEILPGPPTLFEVECIEERKMEHGTMYYKVRWLGYDERTWQIAEDIPTSVISDFEKARKETVAPRTRPKLQPATAATRATPCPPLVSSSPQLKSVSDAPGTEPEPEPEPATTVAAAMDTGTDTDTAAAVPTAPTAQVAAMATAMTAMAANIASAASPAVTPTPTAGPVAAKAAVAAATAAAAAAEEADWVACAANNSTSEQ